MLGKLVFNHRIVNESQKSIAFIADVFFHFPIIPFCWLREHNMEIEIWKFFRNLVEVIQIEKFSFRATAVPESHLSVRLNGMKKVKKVRSHGSHSGATSDVNHLRSRLLDEKLTVRA